MRILTISPSDIGGGAEKAALDLTNALRSQGHDAWLAVGQKRSSAPFVIPIYGQNFWNLGQGSSDGGNAKVWATLRKLLKFAAYPPRAINKLLGGEDIVYPETAGTLTTLTPDPPDIVHCHNLHGGYFHLRALADLSHRVPLVLTLHDEWLMTGHCAYALDCERWRHGCGSCPDLSVYPSIMRDATAANWRLKQDIYRKSRLFLTAPCQSLLEQAKASMLAPAIWKSRPIYNGIDIAEFRPGDRNAARNALGLPRDAIVILACANKYRTNRFKDFATLRKAFADLATRHKHDRPLLLLVVGEEHAEEERVGKSALIRFIPFEKDPSRLALHYQAADLFWHAAHSEVAPLTIIEALACGTPVIATAVGGIAELVESLLPHGTESAPTGALAGKGDWQTISDASRIIIDDPDLRSDLSWNARRAAENRFDLRLQATTFLDIYEEALEARQAGDVVRI